MSAARQGTGIEPSDGLARNICPKAPRHAPPQAHALPARGTTRTAGMGTMVGTEQGAAGRPQCFRGSRRGLALHEGG